MTEEQIKQERKTAQGMDKFIKHLQAGNKIAYYAYRKAKDVFISLTEKWAILKLCEDYPTIADKYNIKRN